MKNKHFETELGQIIPEVDEDQMREVDRIAVEDFGLGILQMMENAGRNLAQLTMHLYGPPSSKAIVVLAGSGGNGGGGICAARHLHNHGYIVKVFISKEIDILKGAARKQLDILMMAGILPSPVEDIEEELGNSAVILDAMIGYSLKGAPTGLIKDWINLANKIGKEIISLDIPSGIQSSNGETFGDFIEADYSLSLALPKPGLQHPSAGELFLGDIGIPPDVYLPLEIYFQPFFKDDYWIKLNRIE